MNFANQIKRLRKQAKLSQQQVADKIGIARATYVKLENNERQPKLSEAMALGRYYELSIEELISNQLNLATQDSQPVYIPTENQRQNKRNFNPELEPNKLRQVLLYILNQIGGKPNIGETVLYKILYFIDFDYYEKYGQPVTGLTYIHNTYGPSPTRDFKAVVDNMIKNQELDIITTAFFNNKQKKYIAQVEPDLSGLSAQEIKHIDVELERFGDKNAKEMTELSHLDTPWLVAKQGEPISYQSVFYRTDLTAVTEPDDTL